MNQLYRLADAIHNFFFGSQFPPGFGKPGSGFTPAPLKGVTLQPCPVCRNDVIYFERENRLCVHGPGPNEKNFQVTICPGSGVNPRWK